MMPRTRRQASRRCPINLSRGAFRQLAIALGLSALLASSAHADWTLTDADFKTQQHLTINTWNTDDGLSANDQSGKIITVPSREILVLTSGVKPVPYPGSTAWKLVLRTGDVLYGDAVKVSGKSLMFRVEGIDGELAVPLKRISALSAPVFGAAAVASKSKKLPSAVDRDIIVFKQADSLSGLFTNIDGSSVKFAAEGSSEPAEIPLANIDTIVFGGAKPPRTIPPYSVRLTFDQGSVITIPVTPKGREFQWDLFGKMVIKDAAGVDHTFKDDRIVSAEVVGGRIVYLTELDITKEEQVTFLGTFWPAQINKNVLGQPMRIGRNTYDRGIGVHTKSVLFYDIEGSFDSLTLRDAAVRCRGGPSPLRGIR